jgi:hypothetical protein
MRIVHFAIGLSLAVVWFSLAAVQPVVAVVVLMVVLACRDRERTLPRIRPP